METIYPLLRWIHILAGFTGFFAAPLALVVAKGKRAHRIFGRVYFVAMMVATVTALILAAVRPNYFLLLVAIFSFYLSFKGYRALYQKRFEQGEKPHIFDGLGALMMLIATVAMLGFGVATIEKSGIVLLVFGVIGLVLAGGDIKTYLSPPKEKNRWFFNHISGMLASYIAAVSAFSVTNFLFLPPLMRWLWATVVGTIGIILISRHYRLKFNQGKSPNDVARVEI